MELQILPAFTRMQPQSTSSDGLHGHHGWKEFLANRLAILNEFDRLLEQTSNRPIRTAHGVGVEAYLRKWLSEFLPKKYGVTSGYVIPNLYGDSYSIYHYDIIIYNAIESPVLWTEGNADQSNQGKSLAIPANHVVGIYEVKSRLNKKNVRDSLEKLRQTTSFQDQFPHNYGCGIIFIDLKESENHDDSLVESLHAGVSIRGYSGGLVLRYQGDPEATGLISVLVNDSESGQPTPNRNSPRHRTPLAKKIDDLAIFKEENGSVKIAEQGAGALLVVTAPNNWSLAKNYGTSFSEGPLSTYLNWSRSNFSQFCINLLSRLEGLAYNSPARPSFGMVFDRLSIKKSPPQPPTPVSGLPFLKLRLVKKETNKESEIEILDTKTAEFNFTVRIENHSDVDAWIWDHSFKDKVHLPARQAAEKLIKWEASVKKPARSIRKLLRTKGLSIPYRVVYTRACLKTS